MYTARIWRALKPLFSYQTPKKPSFLRSVWSPKTAHFRAKTWALIALQGRQDCPNLGREGQICPQTWVSVARRAVELSLKTVRQFCAKSTLPPNFETLPANDFDLPYQNSCQIAHSARAGASDPSYPRPYPFPAHPGALSSPPQTFHYVHPWQKPCRATLRPNSWRRTLGPAESRVQP